MAALKTENDADPAACIRQQKAARTRIAHQREEKVRHAPTRLPEREDRKVRQGKPPDEVRASSTADLTMEMVEVDGVIWPAYNA